jgi:prophage antirepressor-like protein
MTELRLLPGSDDSSKWHTLTFQGREIRYTLIEAEPWFIASDVCSAVDIANARDALTRLDSSDVGTTDISSEGPLSPGQRRTQNVNIVNESGLYDLILDSRKPEAKVFRKWITSEVLPSIRRTGGYEVTSVTDPLAALEEASKRTLAAIELARKEQVRADRAEAELAISDRLATNALKEIQAIQPGYLAWRRFMNSEGDMSVGEVAKILSAELDTPIGQNRLFETMGRWGWIYRYMGSGDWMIYQTQVENGRLRARPRTYTSTNTGQEMIAAPQVRIRPKGFEDMYHKLASS